jgi:hypothetical protein
MRWKGIKTTVIFDSVFFSTCVAGMIGTQYTAMPRLLIEIGISLTVFPGLA